MYLGRSVTMVKKPQSCPICAAISARRGPDVKMAFHGTARFFRLTCTATISSVPSFPVPLLTNVLLEVLFFGVADERVRLRVGIAEHHPEKHPQDGDCAEHVKHRRPVFGHRDEGATQRISNNGTDLAAGENQSTDLGALVDGYPVGQEHVESWEGGTFTQTFDDAHEDHPAPVAVAGVNHERRDEGENGGAEDSQTEGVFSSKSFRDHSARDVR
jgi:hypothetical protein